MSLGWWRLQQSWQSDKTPTRRETVSSYQRAARHDSEEYESYARATSKNPAGAASKIFYHQVVPEILQNLKILQNEITNCRRCPRLREHCERIATVKRRAWRECQYWGKPVPSFGDHHARILILGLAPGAHGSNRTGRMFTGDRSGDMLYGTLYQTGYASQPHAVSREDGLTLRDVYITASR